MRLLDQQFMEHFDVSDFKGRSGQTSPLKEVTIASDDTDFDSGWASSS